MAGEKVDIEEDNTKLHFESVRCSIAVVHVLRGCSLPWLEVSMKTHDGRLKFATLTLPKCVRILVYLVYSLITQVIYCVPIFVN